MRVRLYRLRTINDPAANRKEHEFKFVGNTELIKYHNGATIDRTLTQGKVMGHILVRMSSHDQLNHSVLFRGKGEVLQSYLLTKTNLESCRTLPPGAATQRRELAWECIHRISADQAFSVSL